MAHDRITAALEGRLDTTQLTEEEETAWLELFVEAMSRPGPEEEAFYAQRRELGLGVGVDDDGRLVRQEQITAPPRGTAPSRR